LRQSPGGGCDVVDPNRVRAKLATLRAYAHQLRTMTTEEEPSDALRYARRYLVQAGAQVCIDLANHVIASAGWPTATEFRESFTRLEEHGVLDAELAGRLRDMAGIRNRLVHLYDEVDDALVARAAAENLADWDAFARAVAGLLAAEETDGATGSG